MIARSATRAAAQPAGPFAHGVASGDADHHSLVIWTRVSGVEGSVAVDWEVSAQADFADPLAAGRIGTSARRDHTVKVLTYGPSDNHNFVLIRHLFNHFQVIFNLSIDHLYVIFES